MFKRDDTVQKVKGYKWPGTVVSVFQTLEGKTRVVVECTVPEVAGALHIYSPDQIEKVGESKAEPIAPNDSLSNLLTSMVPTIYEALAEASEKSRLYKCKSTARTFHVGDETELGTVKKARQVPMRVADLNEIQSPKMRDRLAMAFGTLFSEMVSDAPIFSCVSAVEFYRQAYDAIVVSDPRTDIVFQIVILRGLGAYRIEVRAAWGRAK